jgi:hypothetical protein
VHYGKCHEKGYKPYPPEILESTSTTLSHFILCRDIHNWASFKERKNKGTNFFCVFRTYMILLSLWGILGTCQPKYINYTMTFNMNRYELPLSPYIVQKRPNSHHVSVEAFSFWSGRVPVWSDGWYDQLIASRAVKITPLLQS